jgi:hypothetical protein
MIWRGSKFEAARSQQRHNRKENARYRGGLWCPEIVLGHSSARYACRLRNSRVRRTARKGEGQGSCRQPCQHRRRWHCDSIPPAKLSTSMVATTSLEPGDHSTAPGHCAYWSPACSLAKFRQCPPNTRVLKGSTSAWSRKIKACTSPSPSTI